jgi:AbrB family looped-hinge helix DNA binding protein
MEYMRIIMQTKVSARGQIAIPARIRKAHHLRANSRIEWIDERTRIILIPLPDDPITALQGAYKGLLSTEDLLRERQQDRLRE